jgi:hypothetical protein
MKQIISAGLCLVLVIEANAAVRGERAMYVGGTVKTIKQGAQGTLDLDSKYQMAFETKEGEITIKYADIKSMEFGQKVGRRVGLTVALAATTMGLAALPVLLSKKRKHYLTINYGDEVVVLELAKDIVRTAVPIIEARAGKKVELQGSVDEESRTAVIGHPSEPLQSKIDRTPISSPVVASTPVAAVAEARPVPVEAKPEVKTEAKPDPNAFKAKIYGLN